MGDEGLRQRKDVDSNQESQIEVVRLWQLPDNFFQLDLEQQMKVIDRITFKAEPLKGPRQPCKMSLLDEGIAVSFLLFTLGFPFVLGFGVIFFAIVGSWYRLILVLAFAAVCALHPLPHRTLHGRSSRLALALARYFTYEMLADRSDPALKSFGTTAALSDDFQKQHLPALNLACPHGVFNYGAIIWCCFSRWFCGWYQYTGSASAVKYVPGLRYLDLLCWFVDANRGSISKALSKKPTAGAEGAARQGGMLGMVPDGILGAFRSRPNVDELLIGKKRGLMRIACEQGATVYAGWFFGTTDMLTVVQDPFGIMERLSRKLQAGVMGYYGRWGLPVPRRIAVTAILAPTKATKTENLTEEDLEAFHNAVYGSLERAYEKQKVFAGYPDRKLFVK
eukprot:TRINITY_DN16181_c0_g6_i1.p1 TRINITY_DN16181_c0_g6~~TRINITY_DN16181_c0_g6_i1.p1  ORF type:complete len:418 (-),score=68.82 TRINITY_DN16181_c0_g6_i1:71-1249(-)